MSVIVAIKYKNGVVIGADKQTTVYRSFSETGTKLIKFKDSNIAIGHTGNADDFSCMKYCDEIMEYKDIYRNTVIDDKYIYNNIIPKIMEVMEMKNALKNDKGIKYMDSALLIASKDCICEVTDRFGIYPQKFYHSAGCGLGAANGYLNVVLKDKTPDELSEEEAIEFVTNAINEACINDIHVGLGMDLFVLK